MTPGIRAKSHRNTMLRWQSVYRATLDGSIRHVRAVQKAWAAYERMLRLRVKR